MADLGEGAGGDHPPLRENFSIFPSKNERKMNLYYLEWTLKSGFCRPQPSLRKKSALLFQNPRSATDMYTLKHTVACVDE